MSFLQSLALLAAIALGVLLTGRLYVGAFGSQLYRRLDAAGATASLAIGTIVLTLVSIWLSAAGFPTRDMVPLVPALLLVPLALAWRRRRLDVLRPAGDARAWLALALPAVLAATAALLPLARMDGYNTGNDTYTYSAFSEWLQRHGYSEACRWQAQSPVTGIPALYQGLKYDLGIAHWLALVQAGAGAPSALLAYPASAAFGMVLLTALVWLTARQLLRFSTTSAGATALLFAGVPHALYWGHHNGFLQQAYALPVVLLGLVLLARSGARRDPATAALLGLPFAFLVSVYVPLLPTLVVATAAAAAVTLARDLRRGRGALRPLLFFAAAAGFALLFALRDVVGLLARVRMFATDVAGGHIAFSAWEFFLFATGTRAVAPGWGSVELGPWTALNRVLAPVYALLALVGLWQAWRRPRLRPLATAATALIAGLAYYALAVTDPWSARRGHTWNVFKVSQWIGPFLVLLAVAGARRLAATLPVSGRRTLLAAGLAVPLGLAGAHWTWSRQVGETMQEVLPGPSPLRDLPALHQRIQALPRGTLLLLGKPSNAGRWLGTVAALLAHPRGIVGDWTESASLSNHPVGGDALYESLLGRLAEPHVVPLLSGFLPFQADGVEPLGGGFARLLPGEQPVIVHVMNPAGFEPASPGAAPPFVIGEGRTKIVMLSRSARPAELRLELQPYPGRPGTRLLFSELEGDYNRRAVRLATERPPDTVQALAGETRIHLPLRPGHGLRTLVLVVEAPGTQPRLTVTGLRLDLVPPATD